MSEEVANPEDPNKVEDEVIDPIVDDPDKETEEEDEDEDSDEDDENGDGDTDD